MPGAGLALPPDVVRLKRLPQGLELYFPPLRDGSVAAVLGAFGALSVALPGAAAIGLGAAGGSGAGGWVAMVLIGGFIAPIIVLGVVFLALAVYMLANSLTVTVGPAGVAAARRIFGLTLSRHEVWYAEVAVVEPQIPARYQSAFSGEPRYRLIARHRTPGMPAVVIAESLQGRALMEQIGALIARESGIPVRDR